MRELTTDERIARDVAKSSSDVPYLTDDLEHYIFDMGFVTGLDHSATQLAALQTQLRAESAERDGLLLAVAAWKKSAKRHRHNEIRKQNHLEYAVKEVDRLEARSDALAAFVKGEITRARLDYILSNTNT